MFPSYIFYYFLLVAPALAFIQPNILWLDENEVCKKSSSSGAHVCRTLDKCESAIKDIRDNVAYPTICSIRDSRVPVVCCRPMAKSGKTDEKPLGADSDERQQKPLEIPPGVLLHFSKHHNGLLLDNTITFSRPRRR